MKPYTILLLPNLIIIDREKEVHPSYWASLLSPTLRLVVQRTHLFIMWSPTTVVSAAADPRCCRGLPPRSFSHSCFASMHWLKEHLLVVSSLLRKIKNTKILACISFVWYQHAVMVHWQPSNYLPPWVYIKPILIVSILFLLLSVTKSVHNLFHA